MPGEESKRKLHASLVEKGTYTKSFEDFQAQFSTPEAIGRLHGSLSGSGDYTKGFEEFNTQFFAPDPMATGLGALPPAIRFKKKVPTTTTPSESVSSTSDLVPSVSASPELDQQLPTGETTPAPEVVVPEQFQRPDFQKQLLEGVKLNEFAAESAGAVTPPIVDIESQDDRAARLEQSLDLSHTIRGSSPEEGTVVTAIDFLRDPESRTLTAGEHLDFQLQSAVERNKDDPDAVAQLTAPDTKTFYDATLRRFASTGEQLGIDVSKIFREGANAEANKEGIEKTEEQIRLARAGRMKGVDTPEKIEAFVKRREEHIEKLQGVSDFQSKEFKEGMNALTAHLFPTVSTDAKFSGAADNPEGVNMSKITALDAKVFSDYSNFLKLSGSKKTAEELFKESNIDFTMNAFDHQRNILEREKAKELAQANAFSPLSAVESGAASVAGSPDEPTSDLVKAEIDRINQKYQMFDILLEMGATENVRSNLGKDLKFIEDNWEEIEEQQLLQKITDEKHERYKSGAMGPVESLDHFLEINIGNPLKRTATSVTHGLSTLPRSFGITGKNTAEIGNFFDKIAEQSDKYLNDEQFENLIPTDLKNTFNEDGSVNWKGVINKTLYAGADMAGLLVPATQFGKMTKLKKALGSEEKARNVGLVASSFNLQHAKNYQAAIDAGLTEDQAVAYTLPTTLATSLLELVSPNQLLVGKKNIVSGTIKNIKKGASTQDALSAAFKTWSREIKAENLQEIMQGLSETQMNVMANNVLGRRAFDDEFTSEDLLETVLITTLLTGTASTPGSISSNTKSKLNSAALLESMESIPELKAKAQRMLLNEEITPEQAQSVVDILDETKAIFDGMPDKASDNAKIELLGLVQEKKELLEKQSSEYVDPAFKEQKEQERAEKVGAIDKEIKAVVDRDSSVKEKGDSVVISDKPETEYKINDSFFSEQEIIEKLDDPVFVESIRNNESVLDISSPSDSVMKKLQEAGLVKSPEDTVEAKSEEDVEAEKTKQKEDAKQEAQPKKDSAKTGKTPDKQTKDEQPEKEVEETVLEEQETKEEAEEKTPRQVLLESLEEDLKVEKESEFGNKENVEFLEREIASIKEEDAKAAEKPPAEVAEAKGEENLKIAVEKMGGSPQAPLSNAAVFDSVVEVAQDATNEGVKAKDLQNTVAERIEAATDGRISKEDISEQFKEIKAAVVKPVKAPKTIVEEVAPGKLQQAADFLRSKKFVKSFNDMNRLKSDPTGLFKGAIDGALEIAATTLEATQKVSEAVNKGLESLRQSEWYKGLSKNGQKASEQMFENTYRGQVAKEDAFIKEEPAAEPVAEGVVEAPVKEESPTEDVDESGKEPKAKDRAFPERLIEDENLSEDIKEGLSEDAKKYIPISNAVTVDEVNLIIKEKGLEQTTKDVLDADNKMSPRVRVSLSQALIKEYNNQGTPEALDNAIEIASEVSRLATELGQGVQAFALWDNISVEGLTVAYSKQLRKAKKNFKKKAGVLYSGTKSGYKKGTTTAAKKAFEKSAKNIKKKNVTAFGLTKSQIEKKKKDALAKYNKAKSSSASVSLIALNQEQIEALGEYGFALFAGGVRTFKEWAASMRSDLNVQDDDVLKGIWASAKNETGKTLSELSEVADIENMVVEHFTSTKKDSDLSKKFQESFGLDADTANGLAKEIEAEFENIVSAERKKSMKRAVGTPSKTSIEAIDNISKENNLTDKQIEDQLEKAFGFTELRPETLEKLNELGAERENRPEGFLRAEKTQEMLSLIEKESGIEKSDLFWSVWYASVLSGHETQLLNAYANILNLGLEFTVSGIQQAVIKGDPKAIGGSILGFFEGSKRAADEARQILKTGVSPSKITSKIEAKPVLENYKFKGGKFRPLNYYKFVLRAMTAVDASAYMAGAGMMKHEVARDAAKEEGLSGRKLRERTSELMNNSTEAFNNAKEQAEQEIQAIEEVEGAISPGERKRRVRIRANEIIEESIPEEVLSDAKDFAAFVTFNYKPKGVIGMISGAMGTIGEKFSPFKLVVPFTNVVANVLNQQIDYTPWGYLRAMGVSPSNWNFTRLDTLAPENNKQRQRQVIKATMGTLLMSGIYMMAKAYGDDEDPFFKITGAGPSDFGKKNQWLSQGNRPYSVKIGDRTWSYQFTPLGVGLSFVGNWMDNEEFGELGEQDMITKSAWALQSSAGGIFDMSFLSGLSGLMSALTSDSNPEKQADKLFKSIGRTGTSFIPNFIKQIDKGFFDNTVYDGKTIQASILKEIPFVRSNIDLNPKLNALGGVIKKQGNRFFTDVTDDKVWLFLGRKGIFIPGASPNVKMLDGVDMTHEEFYQYIKESGTATYDFINENLELLESLEPSQSQDIINKRVSLNRKSAKIGIAVDRIN